MTLCGSDVAVNQPVFVGVLVFGRGVARQAARRRDRQRAGSLQMLGQTDALDVFHDQEVRRPRLVRVVGGHDVRVVQTGGGVDLAAEALGRTRPGEVLRSNGRFFRATCRPITLCSGRQTTCRPAPSCLEQVDRARGLPAPPGPTMLDRSVGDHSNVAACSRTAPVCPPKPSVGRKHAAARRACRALVSSSRRGAGRTGILVRQVILDGNTGGAVERAQREGLQLCSGQVNVCLPHRTLSVYARRGASFSGAVARPILSRIGTGI